MSEKKIPAWFPKVGELVGLTFRSKKKEAITATVTEVAHCGEHLRARLGGHGVMRLALKPMFNPEDKMSWWNSVFISNFWPEWDLRNGDDGMTIAPEFIENVVVYRPKVVWPRLVKTKKAPA